MKELKVKSIHALARGLDILQLLQTSGALTLAELNRSSGIPKASLLRILKTLMEKGVIWQRMADSAYVPSYSLSELAGQMTRENELVEVASPVLAALSEKIKWPSVLAVPRGAHMEVIETNASHAYIDNIPLGPIGFRVNMLRSASGRAYFANCDRALREAILERLRHSSNKGDVRARDPDYISHLVEETRTRGFGLRDPNFGGHYDEGRENMDDERDSLGVAIKLGNHVPGAINVTWSRRVFKREAAVSQFSGPAIDAAREISQRLTGFTE